MSSGFAEHNAEPLVHLLGQKFLEDLFLMKNVDSPKINFPQRYDFILVRKFFRILRRGAAYYRTHRDLVI